MFLGAATCSSPRRCSSIRGARSRAVVFQAAAATAVGLAIGAGVDVAVAVAIVPSVSRVGAASRLIVPIAVGAAGDAATRALPPGLAAGADVGAVDEFTAWVGTGVAALRLAQLDGGDVTGRCGLRSDDVRGPGFCTRELSCFGRSLRRAG